MKLGVLLAPINDASQQKSIAEQAMRFEALGFNSLWTAQAMGRGFMMTDPLLTLATAAAVTQTIQLGTAVPPRPPYATPCTNAVTLGCCWHVAPARQPRISRLLAKRTRRASAILEINTKSLKKRLKPANTWLVISHHGRTFSADHLCI